jgi:hypothetical protein
MILSRRELAPIAALLLNRSSTMGNPIYLSENLIKEMNDLVQNSEPILETERGALYGTTDGLAYAIKLKTKLEEYVKFIANLPVEKMIKPKNLIPILDQNFDFVILAMFGKVEFDGQSMLIDGREVTVL